MSDVFIIGAGCSVPYGFPTGAMLMQKLKDFFYGSENLDIPSIPPPSYLFDLYPEFFGKYQEFLKNAQRVYFLGFSYIPDNLESIGINRGAEVIRNAEVYATAMGLSSQNRLRISTYLDLKDFEKRNEPEPMPEIEVRRTGFMTDAQYQQEYAKKEKLVKDQIRSRRIRYEKRILKDASAVDLILDYYTFS